MNKFDTFSEAFRYAVDKTAHKHSYFYEKIGMDKGQWSKIYNREVKNPQNHTRKKLTEVVGVEIVKRSNGEWDLIESVKKRENTTHENTYVSDDQVRFRLNDVDENIVEEPSLDDLPRLVRLRDKLDEMIRKLIDKKDH